MIQKKDSLAKNYIFQFSYQALILVIPLILSPYLTRHLHAEALGTYTYINSIAYYFVIAANLGISVHGKRIVARNSTNDIGLRRSFWSLFTVHCIISLVSLTAYLLWIFCFNKTDRNIYVIETIYVLSALFDITWLFYGLENFSSVVIKNAVVKITECIAIFLFVKTETDLWIYTLICALGICLGQVIMIPQAIRMVKPIGFSIEDCKQHIKPLLVFSVALVASTLYTIFDKTLLGILSTKANVAFYEYSNKIVAIPQTFVGVIGTVMFPRACKLASEGKRDEQKKLIHISSVLTAFIGMGSIFGLLAVAPLFAKIYYGEAFKACGNIIISLSPTIYIVGAGSILRTQCLIPNGMDRQFNLCIVYNAVINLILSTALIPILGIYGAVIGTLSAELFGLIYQMILCKDLIDLVDTYKSLLPFAALGFIMYIVVHHLSLGFDDSIRSLVIEVCIGASIYCIGSAAYIWFFNKNAFNTIKKLIFKK